MEEGREEEVYKKTEPFLQSLYSKAFEDVVRESIASSLDFQPESIGRWWGYTRKEGRRIEEEIDVVAINRKEKKIALIECKYGNLDYRSALQIIMQLKRKAGLVKWYNKQRKEFFGVAAKEIDRKERLREEGYAAIDFEDLNRVF